MSEKTVDAVLRIAKELRPDLWARTEQVAKIIAPEAFINDWIVHPPERAKTFDLKLRLMRATALRKAQDVLHYLGVNTDTDWQELLSRLAEEWGRIGEA